MTTDQQTPSPDTPQRKRKKYALAPGWLNFETPEIELARTCPDCGQRLRVTSARKLLAGKDDARIFTACGCSWGMYKPTKDERAVIRRRYYIQTNN
jgi:hypothetical protein